MRDRNLDHLKEPFKSIAIELIARCIENDIMIMVVETLRTQEQHDEDVASGHSWIARSKHQDGIAIDICPFEEWQMNGPDKLDWNANHPVWQTMGLIGESLNLGWGGRWLRRDMGHFELKG